MKEQVRVVLGQIDIASCDPDANAQRILRACEEASRGPERVDLMVFPELANVGQVPRRNREFGARYFEAADTIPGRFTEVLAEAARKANCYVVAGMAEKHPLISYTVFNSAVIVGPSGEIVGVQRKLHPAGEERHYFAPGREIAVYRTELGLLSVQICYDLYFPEVPRTAALRGAELLVGIFNVTHRPEWPDRLLQLACVRAYENMQHVVFVNRVGEDFGRPFGGDSVVASPPGKVVARGPVAQEALIAATLDARVLAEERAFRPVFADRRPEVYDLNPDFPVPGADGAAGLGSGVARERSGEA